MDLNVAILSGRRFRCYDGGFFVLGFFPLTKLGSLVMLGIDVRWSLKGKKRARDEARRSPVLLNLLSVLMVASASPLSEANSVGGWLAERFSPSLSSIRSEIFLCESTIAELPEIPFDDYGGWGIYARFIEPSRTDIEIKIQWDSPALVDMISLVPSRAYYPEGVDFNYGAPEEFRISLLDENGNTGPTVVHEDSSELLIGRGYPYTYNLSVPSLASGLSIKVLKPVDPPLDNDEQLVLSWAEIFCFSGLRNVAKSASVSYNFPDAEGEAWSWRRQLLVDEQTPLGLPESKNPITEIGWLSSVHGTRDENVWVEVDLGAVRVFDTVRLCPAMRPGLDSIPGFGLPVRFRIEGSETLDGPFSTIFDHSQSDYDNPGHNPITLHFAPTRSRFVRLNVSRLWKPFARYPAFLALSEMEVLSEEEVISLGCPVRVPHEQGVIVAHDELFWSPQSLTNGGGARGELLRTRNWLELLNERASREGRLLTLQARESEILSAWSTRTFFSLMMFGISGLALAVALPTFFKIREGRNLRKMRRSIAGDIHDEVGSNLGSIQMLSELMRAEHPSVRDEANSIERIAAETVNSVRDIVWLLRPQNPNTAHTIDYLRDSAAILLDPLDWYLETDTQDDDLLLSHDERRNLLMFFREALHNVTKHSQADSVAIKIRSDHRMHYLSIEDDGVGIPSEVRSRRHFLRALKERSNRLRGELKVEAESGKGTKIMLDFPRKRR